MTREQCEINRKYNFRSEGRTTEDEARFKWLQEQINKTTDEFNAKYPLEPCPECGKPRKASFGSDKCMDIAVCPRAPVAIGG